ncbi:ACT domain-containing protein [Novosphingopyxis sp.]|uniref:ACT domain-containing protein n=1 Tax=Novosphingopyxis sp. TaxID=2709690 RepID=UPI003B597FD7
MSMQYIRVEFAFAEGALRRLLGVIEARGWIICSMQMGSDGDRSIMTLSIDPRDGGRKIDTLIRQISRTYGVVEAAHIDGATSFIREIPRAAAG